MLVCVGSKDPISYASEPPSCSKAAHERQHSQRYGAIILVERALNIMSFHHHHNHHHHLIRKSPRAQLAMKLHQMTIMPPQALGYTGNPFKWCHFALQSGLPMGLNREKKHNQTRGDEYACTCEHWSIGGTACLRKQEKEDTVSFKCQQTELNEGSAVNRITCARKNWAARTLLYTAMMGAKNPVTREAAAAKASPVPR
jgi:hypothetical protein